MGSEVEMLLIISFSKRKPYHWQVKSNVLGAAIIVEAVV